jgi:hypothetical protein
MNGGKRYLPYSVNSGKLSQTRCLCIKIQSNIFFFDQNFLTRAVPHITVVGPPTTHQPCLLSMPPTLRTQYKCPPNRGWLFEPARKILIPWTTPIHSNRHFQEVTAF